MSQLTHHDIEQAQQPRLHSFNSAPLLSPKLAPPQPFRDETVDSPFDSVSDTSNHAKNKGFAINKSTRERPHTNSIRIRRDIPLTMNNYFFMDSVGAGSKVE